MKRIYLDYAATTPLSPCVAKAMQPWLTGGFGNPSSLHEEGRKAKSAIDSAREALSEAIGCLFAEVLFTGGGTESANLAIVGTALNAIQKGDPRRRILLGKAEHHCVLHTKDILKTLGFQVDLVPVDSEVRTDLDALDALLGDDVLLVSVMHANNETGTIQPIDEVIERGHRVGALVHSDCVQTFLRLPVPKDVDIATFSAHKVYGPKGVGAIYLKAGVKIAPLICGGSQEREVRAGTENVAGIVGFGEAVRTFPGCVAPEVRDEFVKDLQGFEPTVKSAPTMTGHAHGRFPGITAETLLIRLDREGLSASAGSACSSGSSEASHVLRAAGFKGRALFEGVRFSFGHGISVDDARAAAERVNHAVKAILAAR